MTIFLDPTETHDYVLECEREEKDPHVFVLKTLTQREKIRVQRSARPLASVGDDAEKDGKDEVVLDPDMLDHVANVIEIGIKEVRGPNAPSTFTSADQIDFEHWGELYGQILRFGGLSEKSAGN